MTAQVRDVLTTASVLTRCPMVELITVAADLQLMQVCEGPWIDSITLRVHAIDWRNAEQLAKALCLPELNPYRAVSRSGRPSSLVFRQWVGWVADASYDVPVSVEVFGGEWRDELADVPADDLDETMPRAAADREAV